MSEKLATICRAKIILSMASADTKLFHGNDMARLSQPLSTGEFVISEYVGDEKTEGTLSKYVPFYSTIEEMVEKLDFYLTHPEERQKSLDLIKENFHKDFNLEESLLELVRPYI